MGFYIYKITNQINGKIYIGQTSNSIEERWTQHVRESKYACCPTYNTVFKRAIRKYGIENFTREQIEECNCKAELDEREKYWISFYHSYVGDKECNGYNMTPGGEFGGYIYQEKPVYEIDIVTGTIIKEYKSARQAARSYNGNSNIRYNCANPYRGIAVQGKSFVYKEFYHSFDNFKIHYLYPIYNPMIQLNINLTEVIIHQKTPLNFLNFTYAENQIADCAKLNHRFPEVNHSRYGYYWIYWNDLPNIRFKKIAKYSKSGELLALYKDIRAAAGGDKNKCPNIGRAIRGIRKTAYGFIWKEVLLDPLKEVMPICALLN